MSAAFLAEDRKVVGGLHGQPELRLIAEIAAEAQGGFWGDAAFAGDDLLDALRGDPKAQGQGGGGEVSRFQFLLEDGAGMGFLVGHCGWPLVIVHDFNVIGVSVPEPEDQAIWAVDRQRPVPGSVTRSLV